MSRTEGWMPNTEVEECDRLRAELHGMMVQTLQECNSSKLGMVQYELENCRKENARLQAELDKCREALRMVEWIDDDWCPWCDKLMRSGHAPDCPRQAALREQPCQTP